MTTHLTFAAADPWQPYDHPNNGKAKGHPVPEPALGGAVIVGVALLIWAFRYILHRNR